MAKDAYWFRHDSTAGRGLKLRKLQHIYAHWGKGIYWDVIELLRDQDGYKFLFDEPSLQMIADLIGCKDEKKFINWYNDCVNLELFEVVGGKYFHCPVLTENMKRWEKSKKDGHKGGNPLFSKGKANPYYKGKDNPKDKGKDKGSDKHNRIEQNSIEDNIPKITEFLEYGKQLCKKAGLPFVNYEFSLEAKYNSWVCDDWKDGHGNEIKNWKNKLMNVLPHLKEIKPQGYRGIPNAIV